MVTRAIPPSKYESPIAILPGETIKDIIVSRNMTQGELATRMGRPDQEISYIINGKRKITPATAKQLEYVLGIKASFWLNIERDYQETLARLEEEAHLLEQAAQVKRFPYLEMVRLGLVEATRRSEQKVENLLNFFRVADFDALENHLTKVVYSNLFRKSVKLDLPHEKLAVWLRMGEIQSENLELQPFNKAKLNKRLPEIRSLTLTDPEHFLPELERIGTECGVVMLCVRDLEGLPVWGLTRRIGKNPCIQLSLRYKTNDHFWFSLFHEIGHLLLHNKDDFTQKKTIVNGLDKEANIFARDILISPEKYNELIRLKRLTSKFIRDFAADIGIAPGIVVGRLQHEKRVRFNYLNELKERYQWIH
ncbi:MAG: ImmA/IrrE family metallo-endopeptidase [Calditrichaeota bacterium]|nr:ImmA/IrrE family metallo-endopeptidase [Calditrichota bacterium]